MIVRQIEFEPGYITLVGDAEQRIKYPIAAVLRVVDIPDLGASKITSEAFGVDRIPTLDAAKVGSGTLSADRIPSLDASVKITGGTITVTQLSSNLLKYLLSVARVDYAHVDYCKVG